MTTLAGLYTINNVQNGNIKAGTKTKKGTPVVSDSKAATV